MYNNMSNDHGLEVIKKFLDMHNEQLSDNFPLDLVLLALHLATKSTHFSLANTS